MPNFTTEEQYLIDSAKLEKGGPNIFMWGYMASCCLLAGFAAFYGNTLMMACAFVVICGFRIYEERHQARWSPVFLAIINKYEAATRETSGKSISN